MVVAVYLDHVETAKVPAVHCRQGVLFPVLAAVVVLLRTILARAPLRGHDARRAGGVHGAGAAEPAGPAGRAEQPGPERGEAVVLLYAVEMLYGHSERTRAWFWASRRAGARVWWRCGGLLPLG